MIRTGVVTLGTVKAVAYREKLPSGGSAVVIILEGSQQPGIASISKKTGEAVPAANSPKDIPQEAFKEAMELTAGMPYKKLGKVKYENAAAAEEPAVEAEAEELHEEEVIVDSKDYQKIVDHYTDKNGKLSYDLLNKDMIQTAHSSKVVREMIEEHKTEEEIATYVAGAKFRSITGDHELSDAQVEQILALLDEVSPKGVLKEFNADIRRQLS